MDNSADMSTASGSEESISEEDTSFAEDVSDEVQEKKIPYLTERDFTPIGNSETMFTTEKYPGKMFVKEWNSFYVMYVIDDAVFSADWDGKEALAFVGRRVRFEYGNSKEYAGAGVLYNERVLGFYQQYDEIREKGKLIFFSRFDDSGNEYGSFYGLKSYGGERIWEAQIVRIHYRDNSKYVLYEEDFASVVWRIVDDDGNFYRLPVPDANRFGVDKIEFDPESDDPDDIIVSYYNGDDDIVTIKANARDLETVSFDEYYAEEGKSFDED
ncbi:MAG: hypothetical protein J5793_02050 [Clostridia bacterium]|nr:hypothetical protein [Clostridia bacterium]